MTHAEREVLHKSYPSWSGFWVSFHEKIEYRSIGANYSLFSYYAHWSTSLWDWIPLLFLVDNCAIFLHFSGKMKEDTINKLRNVNGIESKFRLVLFTYNAWICRFSSQIFFRWKSRTSMFLSPFRSSVLGGLYKTR